MILVGGEREGLNFFFSLVDVLFHSSNLCSLYYISRCSATLYSSPFFDFVP